MRLVADWIVLGFSAAAGALMLAGLAMVLRSGYAMMAFRWRLTFGRPLVLVGALAALALLATCVLFMVPSRFGFGGW